MHFTVYRTTNLINGKIYIGVHKTADPNDPYMGSGIAMNRAIKKYGASSFCKEVLFDFPTAREAYAKEAELVTEEFVARDDTYNVRPGGRGGWGKAIQAKGAVAGLAARQRLLQEDPAFRAARQEQGRQQVARLRAAGLVPYGNFKGRKHTEETRRKMSESSRAPSLGARNSQYGTSWMVHPEHGVKKVPRVEVDSLLKWGWARGRKL